MPLLQRVSTVDELVQTVTTQVLDGRLPPGTRLREAEFASRYDVSRNTLREALHRLVHDGLLVHRPHRGVAVACPDPEDVREIFRIRRTLEVAGCQAIDEAGIREIRGLARQMESAADSRGWSRLVDLDLAFHARLVSAIGSGRLDDFFGSILRELRLSFVLIDSGAGDVTGPSHVPDHAALAGDLAGGRRNRATERLLAHLRDAEELVLTHVVTGGDA